MEEDSIVVSLEKVKEVSYCVAIFTFTRINQ